MTGLDTNVLVRYLVQDDPVQSQKATAFIETTCTAESPGYINHIVLCELVWVLQRCYQVERAGIVRLLQQILQTRQLRVQSPRTVWFATEDYENGSADFADYLVARSNVQQDCRETVTFDVQAAKALGMRLLV